MPQPAALSPSPRNVLRQRLTIFSGEYYQVVQVLIATYLPAPEGWKAELYHILSIRDCGGPNEKVSQLCSSAFALCIYYCCCHYDSVALITLISH